MKKIVVCVGGFLLGLSLWGQRVNHPALLFTKERVEAAKARVQSDTCMARCWADIRKVADAALEKNDLNRSDYLALAYLMADDLGQATVTDSTETVHIFLRQSG